MAECNISVEEYNMYIGDYAWGRARLEGVMDDPVNMDRIELLLSNLETWNRRYHERMR